MEAVRVTSHTLSHFTQHSVQLRQELGGEGRKDGEPSLQGIYRRSLCDGGKKQLTLANPSSRSGLEGGTRHCSDAPRGRFEYVTWQP